MNGTTLCPHCDTRFKIAEAQLAAHQGMVRCGHCLQAFDARISFIPDEPDPQLELPMSEEIAETVTSAKPDELAATDTTTHQTSVAEEIIPDSAPAHTSKDIQPPADTPLTSGESTLDFINIVAEAQQSTKADAPIVATETTTHTLAEQIAFVQEDDFIPAPVKRRVWPWALGSALLTLALLLQASYLFRTELAARLPGLKPALVAACNAFNCTVSLPRNVDLIGIESSELQADPAHDNLITLNALLRNRASYPQALPVLSLTLKDSNDKALARRLFQPKDYLSDASAEQSGIAANREQEIHIPLDVTTLKPTGYSLELIYP